MPIFLASSAACTGSTSPALFSPSVSRIRTLLFTFSFLLAVERIELFDGQADRVADRGAVFVAARDDFLVIQLGHHERVVERRRRDRVGKTGERDQADQVAHAAGQAVFFCCLSSPRTKRPATFLIAVSRSTCWPSI